MKKKLLQFLREEEGVTMIEYALIAALVAIASIFTLGVLGTSVDTKFDEVNTALQ
jgi:pilus assembly protein Flp/PilA